MKKPTELNTWTTPKHNLIIGVDPGVSMGVATKNRGAKEYNQLITLNFWACVSYFEELKKDVENNNQSIKDILVVIENPNFNRPVYFDNKRTTNILTALKAAQNVGSNKRDATLIIDKCKLLGFEVIPVVPRKGALSKVTAETFNQLTGYSKMCSQHARDAAMLIIGY